MIESRYVASAAVMPMKGWSETTAPWLLGFGLLMGLRLVFAMLVPLTQDESYYRLWAQHPSLGYYDHPPGVAWGIWIGMRLLGDTALGVRIIAVFAGATTALLTVDLARAAGFDEATARRAGLWYVASPLIGFGAILALPDTFASLGWVLCLRALVSVRRRPSAWLAVGMAAGGAFLCKYSALFLAPVAAWRLLADADGRRMLRTPWPWLGLGLALALASLNLAWNAQHHWATFAKQFGRVAADGFAPHHLLLFLLAFGGLFNPLTLPFLWTAWRERRQQGAPVGLLWISGAPFLAYLLLHSLHDAVQAHWPAPLYPALAVLAASGARERSGFWAGLARAAPAFGLAASTLTLMHLAAPWSDAAPGRDPTRELRGWPSFAAKLEDIRLAQRAHWVGMLNYAEAAQLAENWRATSPTLQVTERRRYAFAPPPSGVSGAGLIVDLPRRVATAQLGDCFKIIRMLPPLWRGDDNAGQVYAVVFVDAPKLDIARIGCRTFHNGRADP